MYIGIIRVQCLLMGKKKKKRKKEDKEGVQSLWHELLKQKRLQPSETKLHSLQPPPAFSYKLTFAPSAIKRCNFQCTLQVCQSR